MKSEATTWKDEKSGNILATGYLEGQGITISVHPEFDPYSGHSFFITDVDTANRISDFLMDYTSWLGKDIERQQDAR